MHHYVYKLTDQEGNFYYGSRTSTDLPIYDKYMGSGRWPMQCKSDGTKLEKEIVQSGFATRRQACEMETRLITENLSDERMRNLTTLSSVPSGNIWRNHFSEILKFPIFFSSHASFILYVYLVARDQGEGISSLVLGLVNGYSVENCNEALAILTNLDLSPMPNIYKQGEIWKVSETENDHE